ncbi:MAG: hypothetical protein ABWZ76_12995 [Acidimicrobiales bacterium]
MDERPEGGAELPDPIGSDGAAGAWPDGGRSGTPSDPVAPGSPRSGPEAQALADEAAEIRRLVDAGAGSPEAIRELAARLREHRAREEALWRAEIKPALVKEGKGRFRGHGKPAPERAEPRNPQSQSLWLGLGLLALVMVVIVAANTTVWVLLLPVLALLVWAWDQGRDDIGS